MLKTAFSMMGGYAVINILLLAVAILHPGGLGAGAILLTSFLCRSCFRLSLPWASRSLDKTQSSVGP
jgi:hypothetical protein